MYLKKFEVKLRQIVTLIFVKHFNKWQVGKDRGEKRNWSSVKGSFINDVTQVGGRGVSTLVTLCMSPVS